MARGLIVMMLISTIVIIKNENTNYNDDDSNQFRFLAVPHFSYDQMGIL